MSLGRCHEFVHKTGLSIIVPIHVNKTVEGRLVANTIASTYGYEDGIRALEAWADKGDLLYYDRSKAAAPSSALGQPPRAGRFVQAVQLGTAANPTVKTDEDVDNRFGAHFSRTTDDDRTYGGRIEKLRGAGGKVTERLVDLTHSER